jgi:hypothetical protein
MFGDSGDGAGVTPKPDVPVLVPLVEGAPSLMALRLCPGAPGSEELASGFVIEFPELPGPTSSRFRLGAEGSSLFCSIGEGITVLLGASDEPTAPGLFVPVDADGDVVLGFGDVVLGLVVPGFDVLGGEEVAPDGELGEAGVVVVCATAGVVAADIATIAQNMRVSMEYVLQGASLHSVNSRANGRFLG